MLFLLLLSQAGAKLAGVSPSELAFSRELIVTYFNGNYLQPKAPFFKQVYPLNYLNIHAMDISKLTNSVVENEENLV